MAIGGVVSATSTNDTTSEVDGPVLASQPNPVLISSLVDTQAEAVRVFDFDIYDYGTADGLPTHVTQVTIKPGANNTANWLNSIEGVRLSLDGGATFVTTGPPTITAGSIVIPITSGNLDIADSDGETASLFVYLKNSGLVDNSVLEFNIPTTAHGFTANSTGSAFSTTFPKATVSNQMLIDVVASKLIIGTQPSATACPNTNIASAPVFRATDTNNNIDTDFTSTVTIANSGSLGMNNNSLNAVSGVATFTNLQFTAAGTVTLSASATGLTASPASSSVVISVANATGFSATNGNAQSIVTWTNPACFDEVMIVAKAGSAVAIVPTGNGSSYTANLNFGSETAFDGGFVIYKGTTSPQTLTNLINGTTYHLTVFTRKGSSWSAGATTTFTPSLASSSTDHFRTSKSGNWTDATSATTPWESSSNGVSNWHIATLAPGTNASSVDILSGHHIIINTTGIVITKTQVFGTLEARGSNFSVNGIADEIELTIKNGGSFITNGNGYADAGNAYGLVEADGKLISLSGSGTSFSENYLESTEGLFYFVENSICEWQNLGTNLGNGDNNYFNTAYGIGGMPILRIVNQPPFTFGAGTSNVFNAKLEVNSNITWAMQGNGNKTFLGGLQGTGSLIITYGSGSGKIIFGDSSNIPTLGSIGKLTFTFPSNKVEFPNGGIVPSTAEVVLQSALQNNFVTRTGGSLTVNGILDISNTRITNVATGSIIVNGTLKTANTGGLYGTGSAIPDGTLTLSDNSTIDYYATADQVISSAPNYYNITFSGAGTKTPQNATSVNTAGTVRITGNPTVDFSSWNLGSTGLNDTNFIMDGGKFIVGTGDTQPRPGGTYAITGGALEFKGNSVTDIRVTPDYYDLIVSGENKKPGGRNFTINNILSLTSTGKLTIPEVLDNEIPYVVTAKKGIQVENGGEAIFQNNAQLMQDADAVNQGKINAERKTKMKRNNYTYWSSPVNGQNLKTFSPGTLNNRFYTYNEGIDEFVEIAPSNNFDDNGKGYSIRASNNYTVAGGTYDFTGTFVGTPNNGEKTIAVAKTTNGNNLIGNPYPSNIDFRDLVADNPAVFNAGAEAIAYFWTNLNPNPVMQGSGYPNGQYFNNYATLNLVGGIPATEVVNPDNPAENQDGQTPTFYIKPGQGFIIKVASSGDLKFRNNMRKVGTGSVFFNNGRKTEEQTNRFWISLKSPMGALTTQLIAYLPTATNGFDGQGYDAKIGTLGADAFYSKIENDKFAIQGRGSFAVADKVDLGTNHYAAGVHTIALGKKEGIFDNEQHVYLKDKHTNTITDLSAGDYVFNAVAGNTENRFEIVYENDLVLGTDNQVRKNLIIYRNGDEFIIKSNDDKITEVELYDSVGRLLISTKPNATEARINVSHLSNAFYLLKIDQNGKISSKKVIK